MGLTVALQMDPMESINIDADSSFALALEAQKRGHTLYHYLPQEMSLNGTHLTARARPLSVRRERGNHHAFGTAEVIALEKLDVVLLRQDPPFDLAYITTTHLLEHISSRVLVVNDPVEVRNAPEKLFVTHFPDLMPPTLISSDKAAIEAFRAEHGDIVVKPLYGNGGFGVFHLRPGDENLTALIELYARSGREPMMVQRYLPEVRAGDKRIILIDGEIGGGVLRVPAEGEARANMHVGGRPVKTAITAREREICETIGPELRARGLLFVGIDVIGDYLTEINVTSPTGIQEIDRLDGVALEARVWDAIEAKRAAMKPPAGAGM
jgi:glutathione synthase